MKSYISVLSTENYLDAILKTYKNLKQTNTKYPFSVLVTDLVSEETENKLKAEGINVIRRKSIEISEEALNRNKNSNSAHWNYTFDKLNIFELTEFEKIVYLDSDLFIMKNIDELFEKESVSAVIDRRTNPLIEEDWKKLNSGVMVIKPETGMVEKFQEALNTVLASGKKCGDQDVLQEYYTDWPNQEELHLDTKYNVFFPFLDYYTGKNMLKFEDVSIIHFSWCGTKKPWHYEGETKAQDFLKDVNDNLMQSYQRSNRETIYESATIKDTDRLKVLEEYYKL